MSAEGAPPAHQKEKPTLTCVSLPGDHSDITFDPSNPPSRPATDTDSALCIACEVRCCQQHNNMSPSNSVQEQGDEMIKHVVDFYRGLLA